jgi:outer membrane protein assembly factor BamB
MKKMRLSTTHIVTALLVLAGVISLGWWLARDPVKEFVRSEPGLDNRGEGGVVADIDIGAYGEILGEVETSLTESWPRFRGEYFDNISRSELKLIEKFPEGGPLVKWSVPLGEGHAGATIYKGIVYVMDYDEEERADLLRAFALETGEALWVRGYKINLKRNHGMSRTVPAVTEDYILTIGPRSHVMCVNRSDGTFRWGLNVEKDYGAEIPLWYTGQCPLIHNGKAIIATAGSSLMVALDMETGELLWETPNEKQWQMSHSSVIPFELGGRMMYVYSSYGGVCGVAADGSDAGTILWESTDWNHQVVAPSPVCLPDGKIYLTAGYGAGAMVLQLAASGGNFSVEMLNEYSPKEGLASEQQTPVVFDGHLLGILPKDAGPLRNQLVCVHPDNFMQVVWSSGQDKRFGLGPYMIADNKLFILSDDATLTIVRPSTREYIELDSYRVLDGHDAWGPLALADGYMVLRDSKTMVCLDMAADRQ